MHVKPTQGTVLEHLEQVARENCQGPTGHLLPKATLPRLGDIADLPNNTNKYRAAGNNKETSVSQMKEQEKLQKKN